MGSLPTTNGKSATAKYGCLIVLDSEGKAVETIAGKNIQGPWDSTAKSEGSKTTLFVSNALNGGAAKGKNTDQQLDGAADRTGIRRRADAEGARANR